MKKTIFFLLSLMPAIHNAVADPLFLGVVEETDKTTHKDPAIARILFMKTDGKWVALNNMESHIKLDLENISWTLAFDGKNIGSIKTIDDYQLDNPSCDWCFPRDKRLRIENQSDFPKLGNKEKRFWAWTHLPENRPIVIVNKPNYKDHDKWKRFKPSHDTIKMLFP